MKEMGRFGAKQREGFKKKKKKDFPEFYSPRKSDTFSTPLNWYALSENWAS